MKNRLIVAHWVAMLLLLGGLATDASGQLSLPAVGTLYFHRYSSYANWDSELWAYELASGKVACLSERWPIDHAMNPRFSADGSLMAFMGVEAGEHRRSAWDIYLWEVGSRHPPTNLTVGNEVPDEDPQIRADGKQLLFKQRGRVHVMDLMTREVQALTASEGRQGQSMPVFIPNTDRIVYMQGADRGGDLYVLDLKTRRAEPIQAEAEIQEYFPVAIDADRLFFVRWVSADDRHDQIYQYRWQAGESYRLPFCDVRGDYSDPCVIDERRTVFSSTRAGSKGGYDLYLGDNITGEVREISVQGLNSGQEELGAVYVR